MLFTFHSTSLIYIAAVKYENMSKRKRLEQKIWQIKHALSDANLQLMPEFEARVRLLQRMNYVDADRIVHLKGRVAAEVFLLSSRCHSHSLTHCKLYRSTHATS